MGKTYKRLLQTHKQKTNQIKKSLSKFITRINSLRLLICKKKNKVCKLIIKRYNDNILTIDICISADVKDLNVELKLGNTLSKKYESVERYVDNNKEIKSDDNIEIPLFYIKCDDLTNILEIKEKIYKNMIIQVNKETLRMARTDFIIFDATSDECKNKKEYNEISYCKYESKKRIKSIGKFFKESSSMVSAYLNISIFATLIMVSNINTSINAFFILECMGFCGEYVNKKSHAEKMARIQIIPIALVSLYLIIMIVLLFGKKDVYDELISCCIFNTITQVSAIILHIVFYAQSGIEIIFAISISLSFVAIYAINVLMKDTIPSSLYDLLLEDIIPVALCLLYICIVWKFNRISYTITAGFTSCKNGFYIKFHNNGKKIKNLCIKNKKTEESHSIRESMPDQDYICTFTDSISDIKDLSKYVCENIVIVGLYATEIEKNDLIID